MPMADASPRVVTLSLTGVRGYVIRTGVIKTVKSSAGKNDPKNPHSEV